MERKLIKKALISVYDKSGIVELARELLSLGVDIIATEGTADALADGEIRIQRVIDYTGQAELLGGKVKTLHPRTFAAILASGKEREKITGLDMEAIDMVVVNLSPLRSDGELDGMDIGGHAILRAAIKNFQNVAVMSSPSQYADVLNELKHSSCSLSPTILRKLASEALATAGRYDAAVMEKLSTAGDELPAHIVIWGDKVMELRYGENPHQGAALYTTDPSVDCPFAEALGGRGISFNNVVDFQAALSIVGELSSPAAAIIKHANPCGVGIGGDPIEAFLRARETDPVSAFGGIVGLNRIVDEKLAGTVTKTFFEGIIAPGYDEASLEILRRKKRLRIIRSRETPGCRRGREYRSAGSFFLVQDVDGGEEGDWVVATERKPTDDEMEGLKFVWKIVRYVKSNAIVIGSAVETIGIGAGQVSRVDSCDLALKKARKEIKGSVLASDGFFPFRDSIDLVAKSGVTAVIQPGGSIRDGEVIEACNEHGIAMVFTGRRHFRH